MRVLLAPQEFKGTLSAAEAAAAMSVAISDSDARCQVDLLPMADGGRGTVDALLAASGGRRMEATVLDPLLRPVQADWALLSNGMAVVEWAAASGLWRLAPAELDPRRASSLGTGQLVRLALDHGCRDVILGLGGSGTNDGGAGFVQALGFRLLDAAGSELPPGGASLARFDRIDSSAAHPAIGETRFVGAVDVSNPLCGPRGASAVYGPQKGADAAAVAELNAALAHFAVIIERDLGIVVRDLPGAGSAGGGGAAAAAFLGAELRSGAQVVAEMSGLEQRIHAADVVVTGEGSLDAQTSYGKGPLFVARLARAAGRPVVCIAGRLAAGHEAIAAAFDVVEIATKPGPGLPAPDEAGVLVGRAAVRALRRLGLLAGGLDAP